jgi:tetratricopeptide (TPR) repeat protein
MRTAAEPAGCNMSCMRRLAATVVILLVLGLGLPRAARAEWRRITSDHFVFIGDASDQDIRAIADRLELFRTSVTRVLAPGATASPVPTVVIVFRNDRAFTPFKPVFQGKPVAVAGYFVGSDDVNYIAVNAEQDTAAYGVIFHEYAHSLLGHMVGSAPPWIDEGLAEFYGTFQVSADGTAATLGMPSRDHLQLLRSAPLMPVAQLTAVERDSPLYNEGDRRTLFYAQSWALVHYLTFGAPARVAQLNRYLEGIRLGMAGAEAFQQAFGPDAASLDRELQQYVRSPALKAVRLAFGESMNGQRTDRGIGIPDHDAAGYLGDVLSRLGRAAEARAYLQRTLTTSPDAARVMATLGLLELQEGNDAAALPLLERATTLMPESGAVAGSYGRALVQRAERGGADEAALYDRARTALRRAIELEPGHAPSAVMLAAVEMSQGADIPRAVTLLQRVVRQAPGRENYRLMLARALAMQGDYREASALLGPLVARASRPEMREAARELLGQIAAARNNAPR